MESEDGLFIRDTLKFFRVDKPTYSYGMSQGISEGVLAKQYIYSAQTVKTAAEDGFVVSKDELDWDTMDQETRVALEEEFGKCDPILVDPRCLERKFTIPERNLAIVREFRQTLENSADAVGRTGRPVDWGKTIVFAVTRRHAQTLAQMMDEQFSDLKPSSDVRYADYVVSEDAVGGLTNDSATIIRKFKMEEYPKILVSVNMLDAGFDCPEVVNLVMARFTRSVIQYRQMRGRGTRLAKHIGKSSFTMFDFVGVSKYHGDDDGEYCGGGYGKEAGGTPPARPHNLVTLDVEDHIDPETRVWVKVNEHGQIIRCSEHEAREATVSVRFEAWFADQYQLNAEQSRWLRLIGSRIRADAMTLLKFSQSEFNNHPFDGLGGYTQAERVFGGRDAIDAMVQSINAAILAEDGPLSRSTES